MDKSEIASAESLTGTVGRLNMRWRRHPVVRRLLWGLGASFAICLGAFLIYFPGRQSLLAFTLGTGIGVTRLQAQVNQLEDKAVKGQELSLVEKRLLLDLFFS